MVVRRLKRFATRRPLLFAIFLLLSSLVVVILATTLVVILFNRNQTDPMLGLIGNLVAALFLVLLLSRFGWLRAAGIASWGSWKGWLVALVLLIYYLLELSYSFFGDLNFSVPATALAGLRLPTVFVGGMFEEILFRGAILYALVNVWGTNQRGILLAAIASSLLFGVIHSVNAIAGDPSEIPGQIGIALFEGIWWAAIVLRWGSVWPAVLIHVVTNWALQTRALGFENYHGTAESYGLAILLGLPLAALGVWWLLRSDLSHRGEGPGSEH
jgi:membrane protease YdiL (CAAX protease family)